MDFLLDLEILLVSKLAVVKHSGKKQEGWSKKQGLFALSPTSYFLLHGESTGWQLAITKKVGPIAIT
jgi:hypothetical protein